LETTVFQKLKGGVKRALCMSALFVSAHDRLVFKSEVLCR
jgi:hypothetical protein